VPTRKFTTQLKDVTDLLTLAESITLRHPAFSYLSDRPNPAPITAGAVVLLCARFEEFLKDVIAYALERHGEADPALTLWNLPESLQILLLSKNMTAALQAKRFGRPRSHAERINDGLTAAQDIIAGRINAELAIETGGNPGPDTVSELMKLVGIEKPWSHIEKQFEVNYVSPVDPMLAGIALGGLQERLGALIGLRNEVAHSGTQISSSPAEIRFNVHFARHLANAIYDVLKKHVEDYARSIGRTPGIWTD